MASRLMNKSACLFLTVPELLRGNPVNPRSFRQPPLFSLSVVSQLPEEPAGHVGYMMRAADRDTFLSSAWPLHWTKCSGFQDTADILHCIFFVDVKTLSHKLPDLFLTKTLQGKAVVMISTL